VVATLLALTVAVPSQASLNACAAGKNKCVAKVLGALLKCHIKDETPPNGLAPALLADCIQKAKDHFDGGSTPSKGCFAKLEAKYGAACLTTNDTAAMETEVDAFVNRAVCLLDPGDLTTDPNNCGACGNQCAPGKVCNAGVCTCPTGDSLCSLVCVDTASDPNNCGHCGGVCGPGATCTSGVCACAAGESNCGTTVGCVNEQTDPNNCGACGNHCATPGSFCNAGVCACPAGDVNCGGVIGCVNVSTDPNHCGTCGTACPSGHSCVSGQCN
jgi:hypothetical protein